MPVVLVTGATGFIGSHLAAAINADGTHELRTLPLGTDLTLPEAARHAFSSLGSVDYIVHAADVGGDATWAARHPSTQMMANASITLNVLAAWRDSQPQARLVGLSSLWAYPEAVTMAREESYWDGRMHQPTEHYGLCKKLLGVGIQAMRREHGLRGTMLVLGSAYGPGDRSSRVVPSLIRRLRERPALLEVWGDASEGRDFVYVADQVAGILRHLDYDGELLNISTGRFSTVREVATILAELTSFTGEIVYSQSKTQGVAVRTVDVSQATAATGWPQNYQLHSLREGLRKTVDSYPKA